jgi:DNA replication protein DnaC
MEVSSDFPLAAALLDRLTHHCHVLLFQGKSYRFQESRERLTQTAASVATTP